MLKRNFLKICIKSFIFLGLFNIQSFANVLKTIIKSNDEWKKILTKDQYYILRQEGTERPFTSKLNNEKREGDYLCAACDTKLFHSSMKYDSGTGWPSFFKHYPDVIETKKDYKLLYPRTEYHCFVCKGHHGHVFDDGPKPTFKRFCNNGLALKFVPKV
jgi:peptide-methionine (R)-S-oxide reductase